MELWGRPQPAENDRRRPASAASSPPVPAQGFAATFDALVGRKLRELRGRRWQRASDRARRAEAARRGAAEMARRIERESGHRPADSTIRRAARENRTPRGVEQAALGRQARIDAAGGVKALARQVGASASRVARWRAGRGEMVPGGCEVDADVTGTLWANGSPYGKTLSVTVRVDPPAADEIRAAYATADLKAIADMLGQPITEQMDWSGDAERWFEVTEIADLTIS